MRIFRILAVLALCFPISSFAVSGMLDSSQTVQQLVVLINQYDTRIKQLENENTILRNAMQKANIQIPLVEYSGAIVGALPTLSSISSQTGINTSTSATYTGTNITTPTSTYPSEFAGFITRINKDWSSIRTAYALPNNAKLASYEFVQTGSFDHVFVDIIYGTGITGGVFNAKILYQFEKKEFKRKLIGIFMYDAKTQKYTTKVGNNPFGGVSRKTIKDELYLTGSGSSVSTTSASQPTTPVVSGEVSPSSNVTVADITKAYNEKRYLTTISLSNSYLTQNPATLEILSIRYRTYFIIGKYTESLTELSKIEGLGTMDRQTACNAQVIATYSKNTALVTKYATICTKK